VPGLRSIVERQHEIFNARDFADYAEVFHEDVGMAVDGMTFRGLPAIREYLEGVVQEFPHVSVSTGRVFAEAADAIVVEAHVLDGVEGAAKEPQDAAPRLLGSTCEAYEMSDGRIAELRVYYAADRDVQDAPAGAPPRSGAGHVAAEQAALRRVATLVAQGVASDALHGAVNREIAGLVGADPVVMLRFGAGETVELVAAWSAREYDFPIGVRQPEDDRLRSARLTGRPVWFRAPEPRTNGPWAEESRQLGIRSSVVVPIVVEGRVWGAAVASSSDPDAFPADTAARIARFTELVAAAIANDQARSELRRLVDEQAALRRVAELVARDVGEEEVFHVVAKELHNLLGGTATVYRYDADDYATCVAAWEVGGESGVLGDSAVPPAETVTAMVRKSGQPARIDNPKPLPGVFGERRRRLGTRYVTGGPIWVQGRLWGALVLGFAEPSPPAPGTEVRIARFAELTSTAIANAQARSDLQLLVEEQKALRNVATLVARGASQSEVFDAVVNETSRLLGEDCTVLLRGDPDGGAVVAAVHGAPAELTVGTTISPDGDGLTPKVLRTGQAARVDDYGSLAGADPERARRLGMRAGVGAPIIVAGRVWGLITLMTSREPPPAGTERRLGQFAELIAAAIGNAESRAELMASRARIVAAGDEARRRLQRDVHDGAQQRLVHTVITLKLAKAEVEAIGGPAAALVGESLERAELATAELRDLARGILPSALLHHGLRAAIEALVEHVSLPVTVDVSEQRLPEGVETTAYFIIAETLTNAVKHAHARNARVCAAVHGDVLRIEVQDDGTGGVDPAKGSGIVGLTDRVDAIGGTIGIASRRGEGTTVTVELPIAGPPGARISHPWAAA
jgi:signal transduction histidine kinase